MMELIKKASLRFVSQEDKLGVEIELCQLTIGIKGFKRQNQLDSEEQEFSNSLRSPIAMDLFSACILSSNLL